MNVDILEYCSLSKYALEQFLVPSSSASGLQQNNRYNLHSFIALEWQNKHNLGYWGNWGN